MAKKKLNAESVINELKGQSVFFKKARSPTQKRDKTAKSRSHRVTDLQTNRVTEFESYRLTDFGDYDVPHYRQMERSEIWLTWEQSDYLGTLEKVISRDRPEGDKADPNYKRITKNSIMRALVEVARRLSVTVDAREFKNEQDLAKAIWEALTNRVTDLQTSGVTD